MTPHDFGERYARFERRLEEIQLDSMIVSQPSNLRYLFNFTGSTGVAIYRNGEAQLFVDRRYSEQAREETKNVRVQVTQHRPFQSLVKLLAEGPCSQIGVEAESLALARVHEIEETGNTVLPTRFLVEALRAIKQESEIQVLREAFKLAQLAIRHSWQQIQPGMTEIEIAGLIETECRKVGSEGTAFETLVASGPRSSMPHAVASQTAVSAEKPLLIDFGLRFQGYCTDLTRMYIPQDHRATELLPAVQKAQQAAIQSVEPGARFSTIHQAARQALADHGLEEYFLHGTGHGLGLDVHELPSVSSQAEGELLPGMVFTIEPGIYLSGQFGIRLEDVVAVTDEGCDLLSHPQTDFQQPTQ